MGKIISVILPCFNYLWTFLFIVVNDGSFVYTGMRLFSEEERILNWFEENIRLFSFKGSSILSSIEYVYREKYIFQN